MAKRPVDLAILLGGPGKGKGKPRDEEEDEGPEVEEEDPEEGGDDSELRSHLEILFDGPIDDEQLEAFKEACKLCCEYSDRDSIPPEE